jgi:hypothetical protein
LTGKVPARSSFLKKRTTLGKSQGVTLSKNVVDATRASLKKVRAPAAKIDKLRRQADVLARQIAADVEALRSSVRQLAQIIAKATKSREQVKEWGLRYRS